MPQPTGCSREQKPISIDPASRINTLKPPAELQDIGEPINPADYFITTGEVVHKTQYLVKQIEQQWDALSLYPPTAQVNAYRAMVRVALAQAREFLAEMIQLRGDWLWLESEQTGTGLICRRKTSRMVQRPTRGNQK